MMMKTLMMGMRTMTMDHNSNCAQILPDNSLLSSTSFRPRRIPEVSQIRRAFGPGRAKSSIRLQMFYSNELSRTSRPGGLGRPTMPSHCSLALFQKFRVSQKRPSWSISKLLGAGCWPPFVASCGSLVVSSSCWLRFFLNTASKSQH